MTSTANESILYIATLELGVVNFIRQFPRSRHPLHYS